MFCISYYRVQSLYQITMSNIKIFPFFERIMLISTYHTLLTFSLSKIMLIFLSPFFLIPFLENVWAQDPDSLLLAWQIPQTPPTTSEYLLDGGSAALQSEASLLTQADQQQQQQQYPNSQIDQSPAKADNSWDSNDLSDCLSDSNSIIQGHAASDSQQPKPRRARRQWNKRGQQPAVCSQRGSTNIQPKIAPNLIKNPALPVTPTESDRFRIPVFPGSDVHKGGNPTCLQRTLGWLPLGICDSGVEADRYESIFDVYGIAASLERQITTGLENCVLGASLLLVLLLHSNSNQT